MFNSIFGALGQATISGTGIYQQQGLSQSMMNQSMAQQQMAQYNAAMMQNRPRWIIDGITYPNAKEFALAIWPDDRAARLMFALKYGED
jgi:hypothetical protein